MYGHIQVPRRGAPHPGLPLPRQPNALSVLATRWYPHIDGAGTRGDAGAFALVAGVLDDRAAPAAIGASLGKTECALVAVDAPRAVTGGAHLGAGARPRPAARAVGARRRAGQPQR